MSPMVPDDGKRPSTGFIASEPGQSSRLARLSHKQWENTVKDLLRLSAVTNLTSGFIAEPSRATFDNNGGTLQIAAPQWTDYQRAAETLAERITKDAAALARMLPPNLPAEGDARVRAFMERFGLRAYRRPLTEAELTAHVDLFKKGADLVGSGDAWNDGVHVVLATMLQSPHFLYRIEVGAGPATNGRVPLDDYEVASRLSYALTGSMPDDMLFAAAAAKQLTTKDGVLAQAKRLLNTQALVQATVEDFHAQLLHTSKYEFINKDEKRFPEWKSGLGRDMRDESRRFVRDVVFTQDKGLHELLTAPYSVVNQRLAPVYGLDPATFTATDARKVMLEGDKRAGLLTQLGFLAAHADAREPSTILRGAFVSLDLLCVEMPPPPDEAAALPSPMGGKTNRQRVEAHTEGPLCAGCHVPYINPAGFAFENFDALGRWRTTDNNLPVNAAGKMILDGDERSFNGPVEFARLIASSRQAHECYARNWLEYLYGRDLDHKADAALIAEVGLRSLRGGASVKSLLLDLIATDAFLQRTP
jgi:hypothetical protein